MPIEFLYLAAVFVVAIIGFTLLKRPLYECMLAAFIILVTITGSWSNIWTFIWKGIKDSSLYVIIVFIISASLLARTTVIDDFIAIILAIFGRFRGGAGFVAIIGSTYMGSLSGSGQGNVATTGVFTIPAMKRSGFPAHLAANVETHSSTTGNMIPPAGMIATAFAILDGMYPEKYTNFPVLAPALGHCDLVYHPEGPDPVLHVPVLQGRTDAQGGYPKFEGVRQKRLEGDFPADHRVPALLADFKL